MSHSSHCSWVLSRVLIHFTVFMLLLDNILLDVISSIGDEYSCYVPVIFLQNVSECNSSNEKQQAKQLLWYRPGKYFLLDVATYIAEMVISVFASQNGLRPYASQRQENL